MENNIFEIEYSVLIKYNGTDTDEVTLPDGITEISEYAFAECTQIKKITLCESVQKIGQYAFWGCRRLREIHIGKSLEEIARFAFWECEDLVNVSLPDGMKIIGKAAFRGCDMLNHIVLPDSIDYIGESAFSDCSSLTQIHIPKSMDIIKKRVFSDCKSLTKIIIPENITELDDYAFECCDLLCDIEFSDSLKKIGNHTFSGCSSLEKVDIPKSVKSIGSSAFFKTLLTERFEGEFLVLGDGILIAYNGSTQTAAIPENVKKIGERAFAYSENLERVEIPDGVTEIGTYAFEKCTSLTNIDLPQSVGIIGEGAFSDCNELAEITLDENIKRIGSNAFYGTRIMGGDEDKLIVLNGKYLISYTGEEEEFETAPDIRVIADSAFSGCMSLKSVKINEGAEVIGAKAFLWCINLQNAYIPQTVKFIGNDAFGSSGELCAKIFRSKKDVEVCAFRQGAKIKFIDSDKSFEVTLDDDYLSEKTGEETALNCFTQQPDSESFRNIYNAHYKIPAAVCYCKPNTEMEKYVRENIRDVLLYAVEFADTEKLRQVLSFGFATEDDLTAAVNRAIELEKPETQTLLMRFKHENFKQKNAEQIVKSKFTL